MRSGLEFEPGIGSMADDARDDFLVTAVFAGAFAEYFDLPACGSRRSANTCGTGRRRRSPPRRRRCRRGFPERFAVVVRVRRQQQHPDSISSALIRSSAAAISSSAICCMPGSGSFSISPAEARSSRSCVGAETVDERGELRVFHRQLPVPVLVLYRLCVGEQGADFRGVPRCFRVC